MTYGIWHKADKNLPEESLSLSGSGFSKDILVYDSEGDYVVTYYFFPHTQIDMEGYVGYREMDMNGDTKALYWCHLPDAPTND